MSIIPLTSQIQNTTDFQPRRQLPTTRFSSILCVSFSAAAIASYSLLKRCSPQYDPDLFLGYYPPSPCWQTHNTACAPFIRAGTEMTLEAKHKVAIIYGVDEAYCMNQVVEEIAREKAGRKNNNWFRLHGNLTPVPGGILVISNMTDANFARYEKLTPYEDQWKKPE